jgi:hypothetical protein
MKATRIIAFLVALTLIVLSAGMSWAVAQDYAERDIVPQGSVALGAPGQAPVDLGGMTTAQAKEAIQSRIVDPFMEKVTINGGPTGKHELDPSKFAKADVESMVKEAISPWLSSTFPERVARRVADRPLKTEVAFKYGVDKNGLATWTKALERKVGRPAIDSTLTVFPDGKISISQSQVGHSIDNEIAYAALLDAIRNNKKQVGLKVTLIKPKKTRENWGKTITVVRSERQMWLWKGPKLEVTYPVAVGTPGYPTPLGDWKIVDKVMNPVWHNPHAPWSMGMPETLGPSASAPLGTRALYLDAPGIRFHGTSNTGSVGTAASHGCMRMVRDDIEALFPLVPIGTPVYILR